MQEDSLMNRALLKQDAKDAMKTANPHPDICPPVSKATRWSD